MSLELAALYRNGLRRFDAARFYLTPGYIRFSVNSIGTTVHVTFTFRAALSEWDLLP